MPSLRSIFPSTRGIGRSAAYLIGASFLISFGGGYFFVARPIFLHDVGFDPTAIGVLLSIQGILGVAFSIPVAMVSDAVGRKKFVVIGLLLDAVGCFLFFYSTNFVVLVAAQVAFAVDTAAAGGPFLAFFTEITTKENRNDLFVLLGFAVGIAFSIGSFAAGLAPWLGQVFGSGEAVGFQVLFLVNAALSFGSTLATQFLVSEPKRVSPKGIPSLRKAFKLPRKSLGALKKFSVLGLVGLGAGALIPLLPLWYNLKFGVDVSAIGPIYGVIFLVTAFASLFTPAIARKVGSIVTVVVPDLAGVAVLLAMPFMTSYLYAGILMIARSLLANVYTPILQSFMMGQFDPDERATASSVIQTFDSVPRALSTVLGGYLFSLGLLDLPFFITGASYIVADSLLFYFFRNTEAPRDQAQ